MTKKHRGFYRSKVQAERVQQEIRLGRWVLQSAAREILRDHVRKVRLDGRQLTERVVWCFCNPGFDVSRGCSHEFVDVCYSPKVKRAHYKNLMVCGSVWMCPICSAKITERRRQELSQAIRDNEHLDFALVTFTLQHNAGHSLKDSLSTLLESYRFLKSGRQWQGFVSKHNLVGSIRSLEVTYGENGWHPHLHVLMFFPKGVDLRDVEKFLIARWLVILPRDGRIASKAHGVDVRTAQKDVEDYVVKYGKEPIDFRSPFKWGVEHELTKSVAKVARTDKGRTALQLLADSVISNDAESGALWKTYALTLKGRAQLVWSRGLRKKLGLGKLESDEEVAKKNEEDAVLLQSLTLSQWKRVLANDARGDLLEVASSGDRDELKQFLIQLGVYDG